MATDMLQYLDPDGLDETVLNIAQIKTSLEGQINDLEDSLEAEMQDLPYARPDGIYPDMTVGAVIGADSTAQWAQRTTEGSGAATVRSVQGAAVVWNQMRDVGGFVRDVSRVVAGHVYYFSGISAADADVPSGGYIRWRLYTMSEGTQRVLATLQFTESGAHKVATRFTAAYNATSDGTSGNTEGNLWTYRDVVGGASGTLSDGMLIDLTQMFGAGNEPTTVAEFEAMYPEPYYPYSAPTLKPVQIAGIRSTDAQGGELDAIEWDISTYFPNGMYGLSGVNNIPQARDELTATEAITRVGLLDLGTMTWVKGSALQDGTGTVFYCNTGSLGNFVGALIDMPLTKVPTNTWGTLTMGQYMTSTNNVIIAGDSALSAAEFKASMSGVMCAYALATPTTTPISPALPMTYKVTQSGTEAIIVPDGEVSAAPIITVAEPINAGDEFARIWEAIQSLGYTRNIAQLSQPIALTDIGSIDEVQKDTTEVVETTTTKEVQE